jgi:hypothetical protein
LVSPVSYSCAALTTPDSIERAHSVVAWAGGIERSAAASFAWASRRHCPVSAFGVAPFMAAAKNKAFGVELTGIELVERPAEGFGFFAPIEKTRRPRLLEVAPGCRR